MKVHYYNTSNSNPQLSVIIPAWNAANTIEKTLDSVAAQNMCAEVIVVDDMSTDDTLCTLKKWTLRNNHVPLKVITLSKKSYSLRARLTGLKYAKADEVMFLDADDSWYGVDRVRKVLQEKKRKKVEIIHFRTYELSDQMVIKGELLWAAPPNCEYLFDNKIFSAYAEIQYIPLVLWNKIYSRHLLKKAAQYARDSEIYCFDDKFFSTIILFCAKSWAKSEEFAYLYKPPANFPLEKFYKRLHDLTSIREKAIELFTIYQTPTKDRENYLSFINRRETINYGNFSIELAKRISQGEDINELLKRLSYWFPIKTVLPLALKCSMINMRKLLLIKSLTHD